MRRILGLAFVVGFLAVPLAAEETGFTIDKEPGGGVTVKVNGKVFASYVIDQANKPYLYPIYGPTGKAMTRAYPMEKVEGEQHDHPHHRGITFGHENVGGSGWNFSEKPGETKVDGGADTWTERATYEEPAKNAKGEARNKVHLSMLGTIKHREFTELKADGDKAMVVERCEYLDPAGKRFLSEERRLTFRATAETRSIDIDQDFTASDGDVRFGDSKDAGLSIRVPTSMAVDSKKGGHIITSEGATDADAWSKSGKWCDYHGPVEGEQLGVAMLNHPSSLHFPTRWHVRTYGLFTANPFAQHAFDPKEAERPTDLKAGEHLKLRHRFIFHSGDEKSAKIAEAFEAYAKQ